MKLELLMSQLESSKKATPVVPPINNIYNVDDDDIEWDVLTGPTISKRMEVKEGVVMGPADDQPTTEDMMAAELDDAIERAEEAESDITEALQLLNEAAMIIEWFNKRDPKGELVGDKSFQDQLRFMDEVHLFLKQWDNMGRI